MRKLILQMQMSIDGYVGAAGDFDWLVWNWGDECPWDEQLKADFNAVFDGIDCILLSRKMAQQGYLTHWAEAATRHADDPFYRFARTITDTQIVVVTNKLPQSPWPRTTVARGEFAEAVLSLKRRPGGDIICFGGAGFAASLVAAGLVDEFQIFVNPAYVGDGWSIFGDPSEAAHLRLLTSKAYACGVVVNRYAPLVAPAPDGDRHGRTGAREARLTKGAHSAGDTAE